MNSFFQNAFFPGVLSQQNQSQNAGVLTNNARQSVSPYISQQEALMRMGGAMMAGASQGGLHSLTAGIDAYGQMRDYNRSQAQMIEDRERRGIKTKMSSGDKPMNPEKLANLQSSYAQMQELIALLGDDNMTGPLAGRAQAYLDRSGLAGDEGTKRAYARKLLQGFKVDDTLLRTAETKGAISDREMALFESPLPDITEDEDVWIQYLQDRMVVIEKVFAANGIPNQSTQPSAPPSTSVSEDQLNSFLNPGG